MMRSYLLAASVFGLLSAPVLVQAQQVGAEQQSSSAASAAKSQHNAQSNADWVTVVSARSVVGDEVQDAKGKTLGTVEYLLIGVSDGRVRYAVISPQGGNDDHLVPVPWASLNTDKSRNDILTTDGEMFSKQKKYRQEQIAELTEPSVMTQIYEVWAPVTASQQRSGMTGKPAGNHQPSGKQQSAKQESNQSGGAQKGEPHFLVGRDVVATMLPPVFQTSSDLRGSEVYSSDGKEFGEIDNLMIDVDHNRLAYVQVSHGGFLGLGEEIAPIPFEALHYDHERNAYQVSMSEKKLDKLQRFARGREPTTVRSSDLSQLFSEFDVQPYWQQKS